MIALLGGYVWHLVHDRASLVAQWYRIRLPMQETSVQLLGWKESLEKEMATNSSILAWEILWTEEPGGQQSMGSQRVGHNSVTKQHNNTCSGWSHVLNLKVSVPPL